MTSARPVAVVLFVALCLGMPRASRAEDSATRLEELRSRLRAEAGVCEIPRVPDADLPLVTITVLPGDTHARLARELTGSRDAERVLRKIEPDLQPGGQIYVPRALFTPALADSRVEAVSLGGPYPTLWRLTKDGTRYAYAGLPAAVRNLQRLNGIPDPTQLARGARILVPQSLLAAGEKDGARKLRIHARYRVTDVHGLGRTPETSDFPAELRQRLRKAGVWERQVAPRDIDLFVVHTTEHRGAPFENVARFLQRKRLANYLVGPDGTVYEIVPEAYRAFGCGQSLWEGQYGVDFEAINVEVYADTAPGSDGQGISEAQYAGLRALVAHVRARRPAIHEGRVVTHRMVAVSYSYGTRSRKGDPYEFDWARAGLPDNSQAIDQDVLLGRAKLCTDERYTDRVTSGQTAAARYLHNL